ncbi:MAG: hypothetical protein KBD52_00025 [Candidatus Pacebacteria bacterium]|nr:hypothetical protein [Candidatus Paceibacterota bacterium]
MNWLSTIIDWVNQNQGIVAVAIFVLGIIGFLIKKLFFSENGKTHIQKQKSGDNSVNIQSGRDTNYGNK